MMCANRSPRPLRSRKVKKNNVLKAVGKHILVELPRGEGKTATGIILHKAESGQLGIKSNHAIGKVLSVGSGIKSNLAVGDYVIFFQTLVWKTAKDPLSNKTLDDGKIAGIKE